MRGMEWDEGREQGTQLRLSFASRRSVDADGKDGRNWHSGHVDLKERAITEQWLWTVLWFQE